MGEEMEFYLEQAIPILERTPSVISTLLDDLPEEWTRVNEGPDTWSPREVVAHLINGERTDWIPRARIILQQGKYRRFDPFDRFAELKTPRPLKDLLEEFDKLRSENVATLRGWNLKEKDMELTGEHPEFGSVTMRQLLATRRLSERRRGRPEANKRWFLTTSGGPCLRKPIVC